MIPGLFAILSSNMDEDHKNLSATVWYPTVVINTSICIVTYPSLWKQDILPPVFKAGDKDK